jgi:hypothetical protein
MPAESAGAFKLPAAANTLGGLGRPHPTRQPDEQGRGEGRTRAGNTGRRGRPLRAPWNPQQITHWGDFDATHGKVAIFYSLRQAPAVPVWPRPVTSDRPRPVVSRRGKGETTAREPFRLPRTSPPDLGARFVLAHAASHAYQSHLAAEWDVSGSSTSWVAPSAQLSSSVHRSTNSRIVRTGSPRNELVSTSLTGLFAAGTGWNRPGGRSSAVTRLLPARPGSSRGAPRADAGAGGRWTSRVGPSKSRSPSTG